MIQTTQQIPVNNETIQMKDECTIAVRKQEYINFWFLVKHSLKQADIDNEHKEAFLTNAAVMAMMTIESLLNDLAEFYLPEHIFECLQKGKGTKERFRKTIEFLTGQHDEFSVLTSDSQKIEVKKINIGDFFQESGWNTLCELIIIRNKIVHRKVEDKVSIVENSKQINNDVRQEWNYDIEKIPNYVKALEEFFGKLKNIFSKSISDYLSGRLTSRFDFYKK